MLYDRELVPSARRLRKDMTPQERKLWFCFLKTYPIKFNRQKVIGPYIVDFYAASAKLVVEVDGGQHYTPEELARDRRRTAYLNDLGLRVLRLTNTDVNEHFYEACSAIDHSLSAPLEGELSGPNGPD